LNSDDAGLGSPTPMTAIAQGFDETVRLVQLGHELDQTLAANPFVGSSSHYGIDAQEGGANRHMSIVHPRERRIFQI